MELKRKIQELSFTLVELNLYLDTHPHCLQALELYNRYSLELKKLREEYNAKYGPLMNFGTCPAGNNFSWVNSPWPWEN